jgi:hypothetical protein
VSHWIPDRKPRRRAQLGLALGGAKAKPTPVRTGPSEADVQRAVLKVLKMHPSVAWAERFNSRVVDVTDARSKTGVRPMRMAFKGCSDVLGQLKDGRLMAIECKRPGGKLTDEQAAFLTTVNAHGGLGIVADSVDTLLRYLPMPSQRSAGLDIL